MRKKIFSKEDHNHLAIKLRIALDILHSIEEKLRESYPINSRYVKEVYKAREILVYFKYVTIADKCLLEGFESPYGR